MEIRVYVDGAFFEKDAGKTYGGLVVLGDYRPVVALRCAVSNPAMVSMRNVGGELMAAAVGLQMAAAYASSGNKSDCINIHYDYSGIREFVKDINPWKPKTQGAKQYVVAYNYVRQTYPDIHINFIKVKSHTGVVWNEVVDQIAKGCVPERVADILRCVEV